MNHEEIAFFNEQLAGMLRSGIPLEGGIRKLCERMRRGEFRSEMQALEQDLARGTPLERALETRRLPETYVRLLKIGAKTGNLPDVLRMVADYYRRVGATWTKLKGLMVYPLIVLAAATVLAVFLAAFTLSPLNAASAFSADADWGYGPNGPPRAELVLAHYQVLMPPFILAGLLALLVVAWTVPAARRALRWRLSPFKDSSTAQLASLLSLSIRSGASLPEALAMAVDVEQGTCAERDLRAMSARIGEGSVRFGDVAGKSRCLPQLFVWLVDAAGEDLTDGLDRAAEIYGDRAASRTDALLYAALPISVLLLGSMILLQVAPAMASVAAILRELMWWG